MATINDYAALSAAVYDDLGVGAASPGWTRFQSYGYAESGFFAALFRHSSGESVVAFRGADPFSDADRQTLRAAVAGQVPQQFAEASWFGEIIQRYGSSGVSLTGHGLGGALAAWLAANPNYANVRTVVFDALGIANLVPASSYANIENYNSASNPLAQIGAAQIGKQASSTGQGIAPAVLQAFDSLSSWSALALQRYPIANAVTENFSAARTIVHEVEPLIVDLDGDGIEALGADATPVLFDDNGDGIKTATGWVGKDDAFLVLDRNRNGSIDNGRELFGGATALSSGGTAADGFAALAQEDSNRDGRIDAADANWLRLRLWRDLNLDGISQASELSTLQAHHIGALKVAKNAVDQVLVNGNAVADLGLFQRDDGSVGTFGGVSGRTATAASGNPFYQEFPDRIPLTLAAAAIPDVRGAGSVRSLREAASLTGTLVAQVNGLAGLPRSDQLVQLDRLIADWAATSTMKTSEQQASSQGYKLVYMPAGMSVADLQLIMAYDGPPSDRARLEALRGEKARIDAIIGTLERFNGTPFVNVDSTGVTTTQGARVGVTVGAKGTVIEGGRYVFLNLGTAQMQLLDRSYVELKESVYAGLVLDTRLKPYLAQMALNADASGVHGDFVALEAAMDAAYASDPASALIDRVELMKYAGSLLGSSGWDGSVKLEQWIDRAVAEATWDDVRKTLGPSYTGSASSAADFHLMGADALVFDASAGDDVVIGTGRAESLNGGAGNDTLHGGGGDDTLAGGAGTNRLSGGLGNDIYIVDAANDVIDEKTGEGSDRVQASVSHALGAHVENLVLTGTAAINGSGNELDNLLSGNSAANVLNGGAGADTMIGGGGHDTYIVDHAGDKIVELAYGGTDLVQASVSHTLAAYVEKLTLTGSAAINATGNSLNNTLTGNGAANILDGGTGGDVMIGGGGNDTYIVDNAGDITSEGLGGGVDHVISSISYALRSNVEKLTLTGVAALNATGNSLANSITGNSGANLINGGAGADTMVGGLGDDHYVVDNVGDLVIENAGQGIDLVTSSVTTTLATNVEALLLAGTTATNGFGNALGNLLRGNASNNALNGNSGNDILEGGGGNDSLVDTSGTALFSGGAGDDAVTGGAAAEIYLGGSGNDALNTGSGDDVIAFNKGDGKDVFAAGGSGSDTLTLGGGIDYADLAFAKVSNDLVLKVSASDEIAFKDWYAATPSRPVVNLQVIAEAMAGFNPAGGNALLDQKVENFSFSGLAGAFDAARAANPALTAWQLTDALLKFQLAGSNSAAIGGDLAYQYGKNGTLAGVGLTAAQEVLGGAGFGSQAQTLRPLDGLQNGPVRLG